MAQTKKKRRPTKHRGNAAGMIETRGRTGRKLSPAEQKTIARAERMNRPPSWKAAAQKAALAAVVFGLLVTVVLGKPASQAVVLVLFTFVLYIPLSYYTDSYLLKRNQARKAKA